MSVEHTDQPAARPLPVHLTEALQRFDALLMFEPNGTSTVGDHHDPLPEHVDATTGHRLT